MSSVTPTSSSPATARERFETLLAQPRFEGLKAILGRLCADREALFAGVLGTDSYEQLLARLGRKLVLTRQIHLQDCYWRMGVQCQLKFPSDAN